jgi:hypothetical protein
MPENVLKIYPVCAGYRYFKWAHASNASFSSIKSAVPPSVWYVKNVFINDIFLIQFVCIYTLDIAFFWQAHMLSSLRFYKNYLRNPQLSEYNKGLKILLKEIVRTCVHHLFLLKLIFYD